jgi:nitrogen fixation protein FixH
VKSLIIVFGALILLIAMPYLFVSINDAQTSTYTQTSAGVVTTNNYSANIALNQAIHKDAITSITGITSNLTTDTPGPATYNATSKVLTVSGLTANTTRTLTLAAVIPNPT